MSVTIDRTTSGRRAPSLPVRLSLTPAPRGLDGTWWPRSRALTGELPPRGVGGRRRNRSAVVPAPAHRLARAFAGQSAEVREP
ncbi:DUF5994 family protein [Streptomyces sp. NPDC001450]